MNTCWPWPTRYSTRLRPGARSIDVVLVDRRRHDQQRDLPDRAVVPGGTGSARTPRCAAPPHPGVTARSAPTSNASGSTIGRHPRRRRHVARRSAAGPPAALPPPVSMRGLRPPPGSAAGCCSVPARRSRLVSRKPTRSSSRQSRLGVGDQPSAVSAGGQVGLHRAAQQRVARPGRVGEPAVPPGRLHLRAAHGDAGQLAGQLRPRPATSRGLAARDAARRRPEPPGFIRRSMPVAASPSSRSSGAAAASAAADLVESVSALIISTSVGRRGALFHWSLVTNPGSDVVLRAQARRPGIRVSRSTPARRRGLIRRHRPR